MSVALDGPRIPPGGGRAKALVVFLHGYGADGNDLIEIGRQWRALLPDAAFVSPHAPERCAASPMGRQWFALGDQPPDDPAGAEERWSGVVRARGAIDAFLDAELSRLGLDESRLALVGFSQGAMMALHVGLRRRLAPAALLGYSGMLVGPEHLGEAAARDSRGAPPAYPSDPRRPGPAHPDRGDVHRSRRARERRHPDPVACFVRRRTRHRRRRPQPRRPVPSQGVRRAKTLTAKRTLAAVDGRLKKEAAFRRPSSLGRKRPRRARAGKLHRTQRISAAPHQLQELSFPASSKSRELE